MAKTKEEWMAVVNANARKIISANRLSGEEISKKSGGIHVVTISQLRNSVEINPQLTTLVNFAHAIGVDLDDLFRNPNIAYRVGNTEEKKFLTVSHMLADKFWGIQKEFGTHGDEERRFSNFFRSVYNINAADKEIATYWRDVERLRGS